MSAALVFARHREGVISTIVARRSAARIGRLTPEDSKDSKTMGGPWAQLNILVEKGDVRLENVPGVEEHGLLSEKDRLLFWQRTACVNLRGTRLGVGIARKSVGNSERWL